MQLTALRARLTKMGESLPEAEVSGGQHLAFRVRGKTFAYFQNDHHGDGIVSILVKAAPGDQDFLVRLDPERYYANGPLANKGWVALRLDVEPVDWGQVEKLLRAAYRLTAPKRLAAGLGAAKP
ncbi:MAG: MmcQ/YjbR family DNA-binding protein [Anaerolineales bacterium]